MKAHTLHLHGETISYFDEGEGKTTLLFIHGAFIRKEYWREQLNHFSKSCRVLALDLPGHGASSGNRTDWTIPNFGKDVAGFIRQLGLQAPILIGHSFGSDVMLETVAQPDTPVSGLVVVDHMKNIGSPMPPEMIDQLMASLQADFSGTCDHYARQALLSEQTDSEVTAQLLSDFPKMNPEIGIPMLRNNFAYTDRESERLSELPLHLHLLQVDYTPTDEEALRKCMGDHFSLHHMEGTCHYPMLDRPSAFNKALEHIFSTILNN